VSEEEKKMTRKETIRESHYHAAPQPLYVEAKKPSFSPLTLSCSMVF